MTLRIWFEVYENIHFTPDGYRSRDNLLHKIIRTLGFKEYTIARIDDMLDYASLLTNTSYFVDIETDEKIEVNTYDALRILPELSELTVDENPS